MCLTRRARNAQRAGAQRTTAQRLRLAIAKRLDSGTSLFSPVQGLKYDSAHTRTTHETHKCANNVRLGRTVHEHTQNRSPSPSHSYLLRPQPRRSPQIPLHTALIARPKVDKHELGHRVARADRPVSATASAPALTPPNNTSTQRGELTRGVWGYASTRPRPRSCSRTRPSSSTPRTRGHGLPIPTSRARLRARGRP